MVINVSPAMGCQNVCYDISLRALQNQLESKENVSPVCLYLMMSHQSTVVRQQNIFSADISAVHNRKCTGGINKINDGSASFSVAVKQ